MLFGIPSGDFQHKICSVDVVLLPIDRLPVIRVVLISKQILRARVFSEQVVVLKIRFVSYIKIYERFYYRII